jgi:uncharacterized protein (DUF1800 family)
MDRIQQTGARDRAPFPRRAATVLALAISAMLSGCLFDDGGGDSGSSGSSTTASTSGNSSGNPNNTATPPQMTIPGGPVQQVPAGPTTEGDARRFMQQATFGATDAGVQEVMQKGPRLVMEEEFGKPGMGYQPMTAVLPNVCNNNPPPNCQRDNLTAFPLQRQFFQNAVSGGDQLRQRMAWALSQIVVVSMGDVPTAHAMRNFQQMLMLNAFGNYKDILTAATLSPTMGTYLDMANNAKADPARGLEPNENYARELLQLFSIGEYMLNDDGTRKLDPTGKPIPAYDQETIENFAKVFTGWTYPQRPGQSATFPRQPYYEGNMVAIPAQHDTTSKTLLLGTVLPANQTAEKDVEDAVNNVFNHPNVGPYIGKQLIQMLVTSNPTPAYVGRVTAAFNNNGQGVRGDLKAVLRAILLDPEARGDVKADANYGKLAEPVLMLTNLMRGLGGATDGVFPITGATNMAQPPFDSPTVFNYYPPDYPAPGTDILGPQFKIVQTSTTLARANFLHDFLNTRNEVVAPVTSVPGATGTRTNSATLNPLAATPAALVDRVAQIFGNSTLSAAEKGAIVTAVNAVPANNAAQRVRTAIYLVKTSAQYQIAK